MIILREKKISAYIKRMLLEGLEFDSPEQAKYAILSRLQKAFSGFTINCRIIAVNKLVVFNLLAADFELSLWWHGLKKPNDPYEISGGGMKHCYANNLNDAVAILQKTVRNWRPPELSLDMKQVMTSIAAAKIGGCRFFGFRGDSVPVRAGKILGRSFNGMGELSVTGSDESRLPGTSTIGIPPPAISKNVSLAWRAFTSVHYGKYRSLVGGPSAMAGDDVLDVRMDNKKYSIEEYVIKNAKVLLVL